MAATILKSWLDAGTALPAAIENKFTMLPKISKGMLKFDAMLPAGPSIFPAPPAGGLPTFGVSKIPNPPNLFGTPVPTKARLPYPLIPTPGAPPPAPRAYQQNSLAVDIPSNTAKEVPNVYTGTGY